MKLTSQQATILIVDDNPESVWPLIETLEADYEVLCAANSEETLNIAFSEHQPDLILLDIMMPGMDGYEVCERLKADELTRDIPVIFLTGKTEELEEVKGLELGAQDYITKPFSLPVVQSRIKNVLNLKKEMERRLLLKQQLEELNRQLEQQVQQKMQELKEARETLQRYEEKYIYLFQERLVDRQIKRILVVDDHPENIHILVEHLEAEYDVMLATNGEKALEIAFSENTPDLIVLDVMMPGMDGYEVCSRLKARVETGDIPVIFITALDQEVDETKGLDLGAIDFITKPFSVPVVRARLNAALRLKEEMDKRMILTRKLEELNRNLELRVKEKTMALRYAHDSLKISEKKYRAIYENAIEGIFQTTPDGRFLSANSSLASMLGYESPRELMTSLTDVTRQFYVRPQDRAEFTRVLAEKGEIAGFKTLLRKKSGEPLWGLISAKVINDKSDSVYYQGFLIDITKQKHTEEALRESEELHRIIMGNILDPIFITDDNGTFTFICVNILHILGYAIEELQAMGNISRLVGESPFNLEELERLGEIHNIERMIVDKDGSERIFLITVKRVSIMGGTILYTCHEITERKRVEEELRKHREHLEELVRERTAELMVAKEQADEVRREAESANRAKSDFLANMSHELRTPLNAILGFTQLLEREADLTPARQDKLDRILRSGEHLLLLINNILDLSKIEAGRMTLHLTTVDLWDMLVMVKEMLWERAEKKGLQFTIIRSPEVPRHIQADETKLRQILVNLLGNAIKFTEQGRVTLEILDLRFEILDLKEKGQSKICNLKFKISDTGIGIAPEELDTIFNPFEQGQHIHQTAEGTGLGLALTRSFVRLMGGEVCVTSEVGKGSCFSFEIPVEPADAVTIQTVRPLRRVIGLAPNQPEYRILVVDDDPDSRLFLTQLLRSVGFEIREAGNGQNALAQVEQWPPQAIFMDMRMPVMDGYTATRRIRAAEAAKLETRNLKSQIKNLQSNILIIALTSTVFEEEKVKILAAGCDDLLHKPVKDTDIFEALQKYSGVQYVYEEEQQSKFEIRNSKFEEVLTPKALAALPSDLLSTLEEAVIRGKKPMIEQTIESIRSYNAAVANMVAEMAQDFKYQAIWTMIQEIWKEGV